MVNTEKYRPIPTGKYRFDTTLVFSKEITALTLSFPGGPLGGHLAVAIHISPNNGPIEMIPSEKLIYFVPPIHFACSIM
jgi:hypothetical protein